MTNIDAKSSKLLSYSSRTVERAERSLICSPFKLALFETMRSTSAPVKAIAGDSGVQHGYTKRPLSELAAENALLWLIQVGLLRKEVDGQGITDSFRLTPLGRQLVEHQGSSLRNPSWLDYFYNALERWFRLPF
jgi:hypothetical protein